MPQQTVCPSCAEPLEPEDVFCGACGRNLNDPDPDPGPDSGQDRDSSEGPAGTDGAEVTAPSSCVHCGSAELAADGYCESCGGVQPRPRDHQERSLAGVAGVTDRGLRHHRNEDAFAVAATSLPGGEPAVVAVVCDGVSSSARPDEASAAAVEAAAKSLLTALEQGREPDAAMHGAIEEAARAVADLAYDGTATSGGSLNAPACTYVSAISAAGRITIGWVGDTRAYWIPDDRVSAVPYRLTEDDSWAARVVAAGLMGEAEAYADPRAHAITGWLGADAEELEPHTVSFTPHVPGVLLICTDGLWNYAEAATDLACFVPADARTDPLAAAQTLVKFAVAAGGHDNITVAVLPIDPPAIEPAPTLVDFQPFRTLPDLPSATATATATATAI
ncbi:protein phosphatase 2C domain-containing protein [Kitasatospora sp. GP82]|uniref:protein phosphatase 2C domain-containing protein n=1 Tax=Kitasatospora sp. GP82 TaxID=3035089 RepID=UPI0024767372|nr:protein phosphatase 2C domain-containing protein [Kitasatospora sp. GP82]MDH6127833.1 serine/threonine protein phosphatase PrpC [Kitasatospora sp. GP82]